MNTYRLGNISIEEFREFLEKHGCQKVSSGNSGHEKWVKEGALRPVVFQTHIDPIPIFIIKNNLRNIELSMSDLREWLRENFQKKQKKKKKK